MKKYIIVSLLAAFFTVGCTDLDEQVYDKIDANEFYDSEIGADAALASVYALIPGNWDGKGLIGADRGYYDLNNMSTDEQVVPHRVTGDWEPDFAWFHKRMWTPGHGFINNAWNWLYDCVFHANLAVELLENANADAEVVAEAKVLRAFFYYLLMDDFGNVPFFTDNNLTVDQIPQKSRAEIFDFIVTELEDNVAFLSEEKGGSYYGRFNKWAGYALLAKVYLNAEVYTGTPKWQDCLNACEALEEGGFSLHPAVSDASHPNGNTYFELFGDQCPDDEVILALYIELDVVGRNITTIRSFGGTDGALLFGETVSTWNGTIIPTEFLNQFDDEDIRKRQFRYGSEPFGPRPAGFIVYDPVEDNYIDPGAERDGGARSMKWWPAGTVNGGGASNDFPIYRYADVLLMKAECLVQQNKAGQAKMFVDQVRERAGLDALNADPTLEDIYNERSKELSLEGHKRQDMIRFGTFTKAHGEDENGDPIVPAVDSHYELFPIPTAAIDANPSLQQNTGY